MDWPDCIVDRALTDQEIAFALSGFLSLPRSAILIVEELAGAELSADVAVVCERFRTAGDFVSHLSFYPQNEQLAAHGGDEFIDFLCRTCQCRCLVSDSSLDPYSWILVDAVNPRRGILLNAERMDRKPEQYVIDRVR